MAFLGFVVITALSFLVAFWNAFVISKLWNWFGATTFSMAQLSTLQAYGLFLLCNVLRGYKPPEKSNVDAADPKKHREILRDALSKAFGALSSKFAATLFALGIATLVHRYAR